VGEANRAWLRVDITIVITHCTQFASFTYRDDECLAHPRQEYVL